jgi:hypothetical protein
VVILLLLGLVLVSPWISGDHRVLLVASDVLTQAGGQAKFDSYLSNRNVTVVAYNYDRVATYAEIGDLVKAHVESTGASRVRSVGIMYHTPNRYNLKCFASDPDKSTVSGSLETFESFRRFVAALRAAYGVDDVDLISCDVVSAEKSVLSALDYNGARVNASTNTTGQAKQGPVGDWVLEAGNVNLIGRYFNSSITQADLALWSSYIRHYWDKSTAQCDSSGKCCASCAIEDPGNVYGSGSNVYGSELQCTPHTRIKYQRSATSDNTGGPFVLVRSTIPGAIVEYGHCPFVAPTPAISYDQWDAQVAAARGNQNKPRVTAPPPPPPPPTRAASLGDRQIFFNNQPNVRAIKEYIDLRPNSTSRQLMEFFKTDASYRTFPGPIGAIPSVDTITFNESSIDQYRSCRKTKGIDKCDIGARGVGARPK